MPIIFKELKVKAVVEADKKREKSALTDNDLKQMRRSILKDCKEQMKTYLKEQKER